VATKGEAQVIAALAAVDDAFEQLRSRAASMVGSMMSQAERIMEVGTPADKAQFVKTVLPAILKSLQDKKEGDDLAELRQAQADLMSEVREALLRPADSPGEEPDAVVVSDVPPASERPRARRSDGQPARRAAPARKGDGESPKPTRVAPRGKARNSR
jgi:hypothetical protein